MYLHITGHVQGVCFRISAKKKANELGVHGWVQNELDGSVAIHVEGDQDRVIDFMHWCNLGPAGATVESVEERVAAVENHTTFAIRD